jgi:hypothetical protein
MVTLSPLAQALACASSVGLAVLSEPLGSVLHF